MSDTTTSLNLPFIPPAPAQKHVTHNEELKRLGVVTQLSVKSRSPTAPPLAQDGDRYIVADAAGGDWEGKEGWIAHMDGGAWQFIAPGTGWLCWVEDETTLLTHDGNGWSGLSLGIVPELGIATSANAQNPLSVSGPGSLFTNAGSDHRLTINKAAASDSASLIFQTGYSSRAEIGLSGDDRFRVKVSVSASEDRRQPLELLDHFLSLPQELSHMLVKLQVLASVHSVFQRILISFWSA